MMKKKFAALALAGALGVSAALAGCSPSAEGGDSGGGESKGAIAMSFAGLDIQIWVDMLGMIEPQIEEAGYEFLTHDPAWDIQTQVQDWESWIVRGDLKALMGYPVQSDSVFPVTEQANAAGIPVLGYATEWEGIQAALLIDNYQDGLTLGTEAGEWIVENYGDEEVGLFLYSYYETDLGRDRSEGIKEGLAQAGANVKISEASTLSVEESYDAAINQLSAEPDTKLWLSVGSDQLIGAYRALADRGVAPDDSSYMLGALDATNESLDIIVEENTIWRFGYILPAAELADNIVKLLLDAADGGTPENINMSSTRVTAENADDFRVE
ncbi:sugar ABC transporter substrate-binding protein [Leucobacter sp. W1038]|uniref:sugar ABC transporter substrate-binding protein n=1 Tax=Leucobacter sp. W1038 TaxID=3438281 RepID=UPI003D98655D